MNKYDYFVIGGLALWLIETMAFGWNEEALTVPEKMFDTISLGLALYGGIGGIASAVKTTVIVNGHTKDNLLTPKDTV